MAEIAVDAVVKMLLEKLLALAAEEISLFRGFKDDLKRLDKTLKKIQTFLNDASERDIEKDSSMKLWLYDLEDVAYEADNLLEEFNNEILRQKEEIESQVKRKVCCSFSFSSLGHVAFHREIGHKIKDLNTKFKNVNEDARSFGLQERLAVSANYIPPVMETNSIAVDPIFIGRDDVASQIVDVIIKSADELEVSVVPIVGMGGLGKMTLARKTFNDPRIETHFNQRIWVSVSKKIDNKGLLIKFLESLSGVFDRESSGEEAIMKQLQSKLKDARYLFVLDDYLNDEKHEWDKFKNCVKGISSSKGNFIIVTTRDQNVASILKTLDVPSLPILSDDDCWKIIKARTFRSLQVPEEFEAIGKEIACRCRGLRLAANVVGGSLRGKESDYWRSFLDSSNFNPNDDVVSKVLKVSFDRLPSSSLKKCFAYCSIFSKGKQIWRNRLIQLWMAEGFLFGSSDQDMESCGDDVYNILLQNFFLHEPEKDDYGRIKYSNMHDLVHDLSCSVAGVKPHNEENVISRVRYLAVDEEHDVKKEQTIYVRTLFLKGCNRITNMFLDCKYLHVLNLCGSDTEELTSSIDKLIHLRFLDLSFTHIKKLPDSFCKLFNFQTLRLENFDRLIELPERLKTLVGLRHLVLGVLLSLKRMPLEIGKLTCLRTLSIFIVGNEEGLKIGELRNLKNLHGEVAIRNLEEVREKAEAMGACLVEKQNLLSLKFEWSRRETREVNNNDDEVLEGLQPHQNLKRLVIRNFDGDKFPAWTMKMNFPKLVEIFLKDCRKCQEMPTLGHLPLLKILIVDGLRNVTSIGPSFKIYGI
ncbi:putative disease resistance protein RGA3 [Henckelia pumila]|uniref:putative disease resistance protein RGA3 n=1 Tax=Henckelia pumila TaxID=405737 RepID=UPI003C6DD8F5